MRETAALILSEDAELPSIPELVVMTLRLRGMIMLAIPEIEVAAARWPNDDIPATCARACIGEAQMRLRMEPGVKLPQQIAHAQRLARSVRALADHYVNLGSAHE
ncbi:DUF6415 family natural product biosynthesis protein [Streptomyces sp. NBC_01275]|uniref:DUF6415 family natural product biosynthesis protein n=1 Tax=Streptomyces sp. NBC_01275 TaxID=2903807 RepID=UPI00225B521A|nr:DUF6415 family natural product biosynthesis protein [Streptomyces sp. NBC_01275]MCX4763248.1 DUF6415 family natural product biosynthesis protein [Streptomyces sp. NBC_01275]